MIFHLFPGNRQEATIKALYGAIVAQARMPVFYRDYGVPDTVNGRFDMIVLHLALFLDRMEAGSAAMRTQGQAVFDLFCREMDGHFREVGISDLKVPKEMKQMAKAFYGRQSVYREALAAPGNRMLAKSIARNIYPEVTNANAGAERLAAYVRAAANRFRGKTILKMVYRRGRIRKRCQRMQRANRDDDPMTDLPSVWSNPVSIDGVPEQGMHVDLTADDAVRAELAKIAILRDLRRLTASFDITREGTDAVRIDGEVSAIVGQNCVVTLEPIENTIQEPITLLVTTKARGSMADEEGKVTVEFDRTDQVEPMAEGTVDLGAIATEFFLLGIDPYPRKEAAVLEAPKIAEDPAKHPFAALQALKKDGGGDKT